MDEVRVGCRTRTAHGTTFGNYPLPCPRCSLPRPLCSPNAALAPVPLVAPSLCSGQPFVPLSPCPRLRCTLPATHLSLSLSPLPPPGAPAPRLVARWSLRNPLRPSSLFARLASPSLSCPVSPLPLAGHRVGKSHARTWPSWYVSTLRSALSGAPAYCGRLARQWGTFVLLPHAHPFMPPWHTLVPALPSLPLRPPASASTLRSISRGSALPLPPLSVLAPRPCPAPCLFTLPRPHLPPFPGPLVPGPLCPCPRLPFTPPACISRSNTRGTPHSPFTSPLPGSLVLSAPQPAALFSRPTSPSLPCPCPSLFLPVVPSLDTLSACRTHVAGSLLASPFLPRPFPPHLHAVACTSQARTWPSSCDSTWGGPLRGNAPRLPSLSIATAHCGRLARWWGTFELPPHARSFVPSWHLPCPAFSAPLPSGQHEHNAEQFAWQRSLFALSLCPGSLAPSCPPSARPPSSSRAS